MCDILFLTLRASKLPRHKLNIQSAVPSSSCDLASTCAQLCPLVSLVSLDWTGKGGVIGDHCGLDKSTYKEVSANGPVSDLKKKQQLEHLFLLRNTIMKNVFLVTLFLTSPINMEVTIIVMVIQAHKRGWVAQPTLAKDLWGLLMN